MYPVRQNLFRDFIAQPDLICVIYARLLKIQRAQHDCLQILKIMISQQMQFQPFLEMQVLGIHTVIQLPEKFLILPHHFSESVQADPQVRKSQRDRIRMPAVSGAFPVILYPSAAVVPETFIVFPVRFLSPGSRKRNQEFQIMQIKIPQMRFLRLPPSCSPGMAALMEQSNLSLQQFLHRKPLPVIRMLVQPRYPERQIPVRRSLCGRRRLLSAGQPVADQVSDLAFFQIF